MEAVAGENAPSYDPTCYLCPGNSRAGGAKNPAYTSTFIFDNDFPALTPDVASDLVPSPHTLLTAKSERGICRVVCFSPRHDLTLSRMDTPSIRHVIEAWVNEYATLAAHPWMGYVQIFENRGAMMGASNPHPHGQIWATESVPDEPALERDSLRAYRDETGKCLLCEYLQLESQQRVRVVLENDSFHVVVPFWAVWPFETLVLSKRHVGVMQELNDHERDSLADILRRLTIRYDRVFQASFPYSMGFHQRPIKDDRPDEWHFHAHFYPPLLRSATIRKHMVGFELLGSPQRDVNPEDAAARLIAVGEGDAT